MPENEIKQNGFSLIQLLLTLVILGIVAAIAYPTYQNYIRDARIQNVQSKLLENARFLEKFYTQNYSFKKNSTTWAALPITQTDHFCIRPQGNARSTDSEQFTLKAVAWNTAQEPRVIRINESYTISVCESSKSRCSDTAAFFSGSSGTDRNCRVIH